jgi:predicted Abi (CAAX) family protease
MVLRPKEMLQLTQGYADRSERTYDIWNYYTATQRFIETYYAPEGFTVESSPESAKLGTDWLDYELKVKPEDGSVEVRRELTVKAQQIPKTEYDKVRAFCVEADKHQKEPIVLKREDLQKTGD